MSDDKNRNDDDGLMPSIKPEQDEVASFQRGGRATAAPKQVNFNGILVFVIVLLAIMMGVGGYALWEVQQRLERSNELLTQAQQNVDDLRERLSATGDSTSKAFQDMQEQIATNFSEIDKLWGVAYRRNRPNIEKNTTSIEKIQGQLDKDLGQLARRMTDVDREFGEFATRMTDLRQTLESDNEEMLTQVSLLRGQVQDQSVIVEGQRRSIAVLESDLATVQEAIDVIDQYRQRVNQQLLDLRQQVQSSGSGGAAP